MHEVLVNRLGGLSLPRKRVADMTLVVYRGRKTTKHQHNVKQCIGKTHIEDLKEEENEDKGTQTVEKVNLNHRLT